MRKIDNAWRYVIVVYLTFAAMVLGICGMASMVFHARPLVMRILANFCAWSPTIVLFCMFKRLYPGQTIREYLTNLFSCKIKGSLLIVSMLSTGLVFMIAAAIYSVVNKISIQSMFSTNGFSIGASILLSFLSGPTGEECGWRGYLRGQFQDKYGFYKGNIITGLVWTFWHTVLWFVDSNFTSGVEMFIYILSNIFVITSIHMIMAIVMEKENNLVYAVLIHFFFNLPYCFLNANISFFIIITILFVIEAAVFVVFRERRMKLEHREKNDKS